MLPKNKICILILSLFFIFCKVTCEVDTPSLRNPDGMTRSSCGGGSKNVLLALLVQKETLVDPRIKIKAPQNLGNLSVEIQSNVIQIEAGKTSSAVNVKLEKGIYSIVTSEKTILFKNNLFDFNANIVDGYIIRKEGKLAKNKCYLFDGIDGEILEQSCVNF